MLLGFGVYSIFYFILKNIFKESKALAEFDKSAIRVVLYVGIIWFAVWLFGLYSYYSNLELEPEQLEYLNYITGKYAFPFSFQPLFWLSLTQLFRLKFVRMYLFFRIVISILFAVSIEKLIIWTTLFHRDYLPSDHIVGINFTISPKWYLLEWIIKILTFIVLTISYHIIRLSYKKAKAIKM